MTPTAALEAALADLTGPTFGPTDPGYDAAKRVYNAMIDKSPALIVQAHTVADVVAGVNAAREQQLLLAVRGGGHNGGGLGTATTAWSSTSRASTRSRWIPRAGP